MEMGQTNSTSLPVFDEGGGAYRGEIYSISHSETWGRSQVPQREGSRGRIVRGNGRIIKGGLVHQEGMRRSRGGGGNQEEKLEKKEGN